MAQNKTKAPRATNSAMISFGLVSIPVKLYSSAVGESVSFRQLAPKSKNPCKQKLWDPVEDVEVSRAEVLKGFEVSKDQFVVFSPDELTALAAENSKTIDIVEFVPDSSTDQVYIEKSYYLGPDKGGNKAYRLLAKAMRDKGSVALGKWCNRGKDLLVMVRPYEDGLMLQQLYYANEVRSFENIAGADVDISDRELELAGRLVDQLSSETFDASKYNDEYAARVLAVAEKKAAGESVSIEAVASKQAIPDTTEALMASLEALNPKKPAKKKSTKKTTKNKRKAG